MKYDLLPIVHEWMTTIFTCELEQNVAVSINSISNLIFQLFKPCNPFGSITIQVILEKISRCGDNKSWNLPLGTHMMNENPKE